MRTDIFGLTPRQHDMFGEAMQTLDPPMTPEEMRRELHQALAELRDAEAMPWKPTRLAAHRTAFEDMAARLPAAEGEALLRDFNADLRRLRVIAD